MLITVRRNGCKIVSVKEIKHLVGWTLDHLISDEQIKNELEVVVSFHELYDSHGVLDDTDDREPPRTFEMLLDKKRKKRSILRTIIHECCHIKQFALGELQIEATRAVFKKDEYILESEDFWNTEHEYYKYPWEIEAYGVEECYYEIYRQTVATPVNQKKICS